MSLLDNILMQALGYGCAAIGVAIAFRTLRYPDLSADGSFMIGASISAVAIVNDVPVWLATLLGFLAGACAGGLTGLLHTGLRVNRLLSGILTSMVCYSLAFRILGRSNLGLLDVPTLFSAAERLEAHDPLRLAGVHPASLAVAASVTAATMLGVQLLLRSDLGLVLRTTGANERLAKNFGHSPGRYRVLGLAFANSLIALSGILVSSKQGFVDVNMGTGIVLILVAALVLGEEFLRVLKLDPRDRPKLFVVAPTFGALLYFSFFLVMLRASTQGFLPFKVLPTDLKLVSAALVAAVYLIRLRRPTDEELLPL